MTNLLIALRNISSNPITDVLAYYKSSNRANNMGDALEKYIKDMFCNASSGLSIQEIDNLYSECFSYLGNQNNPPDFIIRNGDAVEVKKIETIGSALALNSSHPKDKLYSNDSRITNECRECEGTKRSVKDILYAVGLIPSGTNKIKTMWFVYGDCYAASREIYQRISDKISNGIKEIPDVEFLETNELAKVKKVDPLGITDLRVRGMWHIENPVKVFRDYFEVKDNNFALHALMLEEKYMSFPIEDRQNLEALQSDKFIIEDITIKSPNNPANLLKAKFISYKY